MHFGIVHLMTAVDGLRELRHTRQVAGEPRRRWFSSPDLDLIVWLADDEQLVGFQLCYDKSRAERALTWRRARGYDHMAVDDGESRSGGYKSTPILLADGFFDAGRVTGLFVAASADVPQDIRSTVTDLLNAYG